MSVNDIVLVTKLVCLVCRYLMRFLQKLAERSDVNKMSTTNLAIVLGPNLLWPQGDRMYV